jgi:hypothetical protein
LRVLHRAEVFHPIECVVEIHEPEVAHRPTVLTGGAGRG